MPTASPQNDDASNTARVTGDSPTGGSPTGVSMSRLLASCAAARAVSTPPPPPESWESGTDPVPDDTRVPVIQDPRRTTPADTPGQRRREAA